MSLWAIGNLVLLLVIVPVLVALLNRVLGALERIRGAADDALAGGVALIGELDTTPALLEKTDDVIKEVANGAGMPVPSRSCWDKDEKMQTVAVVSLVLFTLIIAAAALGLIRVILHLRAVVKTLDALDGGVQVIVAKTATVGSTVDSVNASLAPVRSFAESI
jgi:hypothetical protein